MHFVLAPKYRDGIESGDRCILPALLYSNNIVLTPGLPVNQQTQEVSVKYFSYYSVEFVLKTLSVPFPIR